MDRAAFKQQLAQLPIAQAEFFRTDELTFSPRIRTVCEQECPRYATTWACPPAVGTLAECKARCLSYAEGLLLVSLAEVSDISDLAQTLPTRSFHEKLTQQAAQLLKAQGLTPFVLSAESCALCSRCSYPDAPCRHPQQMFPCVESHGIVISALAEKFGIDYQYGGNVVTWFSLLLFG